MTKLSSMVKVGYGYGSQLKAQTQVVQSMSPKPIIIPITKKSKANIKKPQKDTKTLQGSATPEELKCNLCQGTFFDTETFKSHMTTVHDLNCQVIDVDFTTLNKNSSKVVPENIENLEHQLLASYGIQKEIQPVQKLICSLCENDSNTFSSVSYVNQESLDNHIKNVHGTVIEFNPFSARAAEKEIVYYDPLAVSEFEIVPDVVETKTVEQILPMTDFDQKKPLTYNYSCNMCGLRFAAQEKMMSHLIKDHGIRL